MPHAAAVSHAPRLPNSGHSHPVGTLPNVQTSATTSSATSFMFAKSMTEPMDHTRREVDLKKRPSLLSDFHLSQTNHLIPHMPNVSSSSEKISVSACSQRDGSAIYQRKSLDSQIPVYTPQVENISPTPDDLGDILATDKDEILDTIKKVDREIALVEEKVRKLQKKKLELEESTSAVDDETVETPPLVAIETKQISQFEHIYEENRKKAASAHAKLAFLDPPGGYPPNAVPFQPWDTKLFEEIRKKHETFKPRLIAYLKRLKEEKETREKLLADKYNGLMQEWTKKVERMEKNPKKIARDQKNREIFEKTFPELRKQREERERMMRMDGRTNELGYDLCYIQDEEEKIKMRQNAVLPPIMLDERSQKRFGFINNNNFVRDPIGDQKFRLDLFKISWSEEEKQLFKQKVIQYGKNFAAIAMFFSNKTTKDCVQYYYLTKKRGNYKQLLRRPYRRRGKPYKPPQMPRVEDSLKEGAESNDADSSMNPAVEETKVEPEYFCIECRSKIDLANPGRVLTRSCYEQYGLDPLDPSAQDARICSKCRLSDVRRHRTQCPVGVCNGVKRRMKPKIFPARWYDLSTDQKKLLSDEFRIPENTNRCCGSCYKRLFRRIEIVLTTETVETGPKQQEIWTEEEITKLKEAVSTLGPKNWVEISNLFIGKSAEACCRYYTTLQQTAANNEAKSKVKLGQVPGIEEEEEEEELAVSDEEDVVQTSSVDNSCVPSPKVASTANDASIGAGSEDTSMTEMESSVPPSQPVEADSNADVKPVLPLAPSEKPEPAPVPVEDDDNDSCATLSADEAQTDVEKGQTPRNSNAIFQSSGFVLPKIEIPSPEKQTNSAALGQTMSQSQAGPQATPGGVLSTSRQAYKPKSRQIIRVEEENRLAAASAASRYRDFSAASIISSTPTPTMVPTKEHSSPAEIPKTMAEIFAPTSTTTSTEDLTALEMRSESPVVVKIINRSSNKNTQQQLYQQQHVDKKSPKPMLLDCIRVMQHNFNSPIGEPQTTSSPLVRGSLTTGRPLVPPPMQPLQSQHVVDSRLYRIPPGSGSMVVKTDETGRALSADTFKDQQPQRVGSVEQARFTPSAAAIRDSTSNSASPSAASLLMGHPSSHPGMPPPAFDPLALLRQQQQQQQLQQQSKQELYEQHQQQQAVAAAALYNQALMGSLPAVQLLNDYHTAMQMHRPQQGQPPAAPTSTLDMVSAAAQQQIEAQKAAAAAAAMNLEAQNAAYLQRQMVEQHFLEHQYRLEHQRIMAVAEQQQRLIMASEIEKMRLVEQIYREHQHQQAQAQHQMQLHHHQQQQQLLQQQQQQQQQQEEARRAKSANVEPYKRTIEMQAQQRPQPMTQPGVLFQPHGSASHSPIVTSHQQQLGPGPSQQQQQPIYSSNAGNRPKISTTPTNMLKTELKTPHQPQQMHSPQPVGKLTPRLLDQLHATIAAGGHLPSARQSIIQQGPMKSSNLLQKDNPFLDVQVEPPSTRGMMVSGAIAVPQPGNPGFLGAQAQFNKDSMAQPMPTKAAMKEFPQPLAKKSTTSINDLFSQNLIQSVSRSILSNVGTQQQSTVSHDTQSMTMRLPPNAEQLGITPAVLPPGRIPLGHMIQPVPAPSTTPKTAPVAPSGGSLVVPAGSLNTTGSLSAPVLPASAGAACLYSRKSPVRASVPISVVVTSSSISHVTQQQLNMKQNFNTQVYPPPPRPLFLNLPVPAAKEPQPQMMVKDIVPLSVSSVKQADQITCLGPDIVVPLRAANTLAPPASAMAAGTSKVVYIDQQSDQKMTAQSLIDSMITKHHSELATDNPKIPTESSTGESIFNNPPPTNLILTRQTNVIPASINETRQITSINEARQINVMPAAPINETRQVNVMPAASIETRQVNVIPAAPTETRQVNVAPIIESLKTIPSKLHEYPQHVPPHQTPFSAATSKEVPKSFGPHFPYFGPSCSRSPPNIIQQIDNIIIGVYNTKKSVPTSSTPEKIEGIGTGIGVGNSGKSAPPAAACIIPDEKKRHQEVLEPVTPESAAPPNFPLNQVTPKKDGNKINSSRSVTEKLEPVTPVSDSEKQVSSDEGGPSTENLTSFEYDLEPVSPPDSSGCPMSGDDNSNPAETLQSVVGGPPGPWPIATGSCGDRPPSIATPVASLLPAPKCSSAGGVPGPSFVAFNVFTLPTIAASQPSSHLPWEPSGVVQGTEEPMHYPEKFPLGGNAEDNESVRAVAALIETEFNDSKPSVGNLPGAVYRRLNNESGSATAQASMPTYEPLSDDED